DAGLARSRVDDPPDGGAARRLRGFRRVRPERARADRAAAHAAAAVLLGVDCPALGRPGVPGGVSVVRDAAVLAGTGAGDARAGGGDGGAGDRGGLSGAFDPRYITRLNQTIDSKAETTASAAATAANSDVISVSRVSKTSLLVSES